MYLPSKHKIEDPDLIAALMREYPFVTMVSTGDDGIPVATHLPILVESGEPLVLVGHIARQNTQWKLWDSPVPSMVIFSGPHGYVSPRWYASRPNVPTWNYVSIHAYGRPEVITDQDEALSHLKRIVGVFDPELRYSQSESTTDEFFLKHLPGIVAFRMSLDRIDAKAKLNQNKSKEDQRAVKDHYRDSVELFELRMHQLMDD